MSDVVLFDVFQTLGFEVAESRHRRMVAFHAYPSAPTLLEGLRDARLGVFSLDPDVPVDNLRRLLSEEGLIPPIDPELVAVAVRGDETPFARLLTGAGVNPDQAVFVSLAASLRVRALREKLRVAPHPALTGAVLAGQSLHLVRLAALSPDASIDWRSILEGLDAVPVLLAHEPEPVAYVITSRPAVDAVKQGGTVGARELGDPDLVARSTLVLVQLTPERVSADAELEGFVNSFASGAFPLAHATPNGWLLALPSHQSLESLHPPPSGAGHGLTRLLLPDLSVLKAPALRGDLSGHELTSEESHVLEGLDASVVRRRVESWFERAGRREGEEHQP